MKKGCLISLGVFILFGVIGALFGEDDNTQEEKMQSDSVAAAVVAADEEDENGWTYQSQKDEMTDAETTFASITSTNSEEFDFPYEGGSYMTLTVRGEKGKAANVYIRISKGQFVANQFTGNNYVTVRFDNEQAMKFYTANSSDASTDVLFIQDAAKFLKKAKAANTIKIEASFFQEGDRVFSFECKKPLVW